MREKILKELAAYHAAHPWRILAYIGIVTIVFAIFAGRLTINMRTSDLLPSKDEKVVQFNKILDEFVTATNLVVVVQGEEDRIKAFADGLAPQILTLIDSSRNDDLREQISAITQKIDKLERKEGKDEKIKELQSRIRSLQARIDMRLFQRIDYKSEIDFLKHHALMLVKENDLSNIKGIYGDPNLVGLLTNLNDSMEKEYIGQQESISTREKEDGAVEFLDGIENLVARLEQAAAGESAEEPVIRAAVDKLLLGEPYFLSYDKTTLVLNAVPNFSLMDRDYIMTAAVQVQDLLDAYSPHFPDVKAGMTGQIAREHDEQVYAERSFGFTTLIALVFILLLLMFSFRMWVAPIFAIVNLFVGLIWALGGTALVVGQLNMFTSMMSVVLLGLGIDFSIHLISGFTEWRAAGDDIAAALEKTFLKNGKGIITGALTTACAFLTLVVSRARGMKELGVVTGAGLLSVLLATLLFLPTLLVLRERLIEKKRARKGDPKEAFIQRDLSIRSLGRISEWMASHYVFSLASAVAVSAFLIWAAVQIRWDYDFRNMEPEGLVSMELMDTIEEKFDLSMEYALVLADGVDESRELGEKYRDLATVALTNDISLYLPSREQQRNRKPYVSEIRDRIRAAHVQESFSAKDLSIFLQEVDRLEMNIIEMQDMAYLGGQDKVDAKCQRIVGDPEAPDSPNLISRFRNRLSVEDKVLNGLGGFQRSFAPYFKESVNTMCSTDPIQLEDLPPSVLDQYSNRDRDQFLITVYPSGSIYDGAFLNRFVDDLVRISPKATGTAPLTQALMKVLGQDGRNAMILTLLIVFLLLWVDFKSARYSLMAMVPLALGVFWMVGLMYLVGIKLAIMNVMGLPLIIGIGIDDGVHIIHRWKHEGRGKVHTIFSSTGKAILLTSLTTMFAFGSMIFSVFPAWGVFGGSLFLGVAACFLTAIVILPGLIGWIEKKH